MYISIFDILGSAAPLKAVINIYLKNKYKLCILLLPYDWTIEKTVWDSGSHNHLLLKVSLKFLHITFMLIIVRLWWKLISDGIDFSRPSISIDIFVSAKAKVLLILTQNLWQDKKLMHIFLSLSVQLANNFLESAD